MNITLFNLINGWAGHYHWLDQLMIFSAQYLWVVLVLAALALAFWRRNKDIAIAAVGLAGFSKLVIVNLVKWLYLSPRPDIILKATTLVPPDSENSFPSGHATFVFALATAVYLYDKKWGTWFFVFAALVSFSRIFVGVHWPSDVLAGIILGILIGWLGNKIYLRYKYIFGL